MREFDLDMMRCPLELRPEIPSEGHPPSTTHARSEHTQRVTEYLLRQAAEEGAQMVIPDFIPNTHLAMALAEIGRDGGEELHAGLHAAIFSAYFEHAADIGRREVLLGIGERHGIPGGDVEKAWDDGEYDTRLSRFRKFALDLGVDSTPAALICNELLLGVRPYRILKEAVERCLTRPGTPSDDYPDA